MTRLHDHGGRRASPGAGAAVRVSLTKYAWLAIAAAVATISIKTLAYVITDSVGLLSDAAESTVNLVAAVIVLVSLRVASLPPDENHHFGHGKVEYFSAGLEGLMIFVAASVIIVEAVRRFIDPVPIGNVGLGVAVSMIATAINLGVGLLLIRTGRLHRSRTLEADGRHLMTDVYTSIGVVIAVIMVAVTGWLWLDPTIALVVAVNILVVGARLVSGSVSGLMDVALPQADHDRIAAALQRFTSDEVTFHALQTRESGHRRFVSVHVLVPGSWTVQRGHDLLEEIEDAVRAELEFCEVHTHLEPIEDPRAYDDYVGGVAIPPKVTGSGDAPSQDPE